MFIVLRNLSANGFSWKLGTEPLLIGRGHDCDIRVFDSELSRQHAKVWLDRDLVHFEDLGSSNATLANGKPCIAGTLKPGDTLGAGSTIFLIAEDLDDFESDQSTNPEKTPITLSARIESYVGAPGEDGQESSTHRTVHELHDLFQFGRAMGAVETVCELAGLLERTLREQFEPHDLWIAWRYANDQPMLLEGTEPLERRDDPPLDLLHRALNSREGVVTPSVYRSGDLRIRETLMAVPLVHADQALGGFVLRGRMPGRLYAEDDLHYALGIAAIVAPHVRAVRHAEQLRRDNRVLQSRVGYSEALLGESPLMAEVRVKLARAGTSALPVLLHGETGTGKELAARMLHDASPRREGPYVVVNCAAIPDHLFESEFFGHEIGAFTGATKQRLGYFEEAHGGTLFLDEVGDLSTENQARILRAIETNTFRRVGGNAPIHVDVRIVSATNKSLEAPDFRLDLLHRLNNITISMPPLRERPEDIPMFIEHFMRISGSHGPERVTHVHPDALIHLQKHPWPGNVRELKALIDRAIVFATSHELRSKDFPFAPGEFSGSNTSDVQSRDNCDTPAPLPLAEIERVHIQHVLQICDGNIAEAARILQMNRATLYRRIAEYGVN